VRGRLAISRQSLNNRFQNRLALLQHLVIPVTQYLVTLLFQELGARVVVVLLLPVLRAIDLDHQTLLATDEIHDVLSDQRLTSEFMAEQLPIAQPLPQPAFRIGAVPAKFPRMALLQRWVFMHGWLPN
jgi:hypothetical protein